MPKLLWPVVGVLVAVSVVFAASPPAAGLMPGDARTGASQTQPQPPSALPRMIMGPPSYDNGRCLRELFTHPEQWKETRAAIDALAYADHNLDRQFTDDELRAWLPQLQQWGVRLELEVGGIKPWGTTGEKCFAIQKPKWDRFQRLGGKISSIGMDEPLCCVRKDLKQPDEYAVAETARFIALVRQNYPQVLIGDIEPYPFVPMEDLTRFIDALEKRLAEQHVRGLDFFRLDVNWQVFVVRNEGSWGEVRKIEQHCRRRKLPFSMIYWPADYPALKRRGLADDAAWYASMFHHAHAYSSVEGKPDQFMVQSWVEGPARIIPEGEPFTFTRAVLDFTRKFGGKEGGGERNKKPLGD